MMTPAPLESAGIYALPLLDRWLLFAPDTWNVALVNRYALGEIADCLRPGHEAPSLEALDLWQTLTIASGSANGRAVRPPEPPKLVIMPTRACNIRCIHCDFGSPDAPLTVLDPRLAAPLVERMAAEAARRGEHVLQVHFFGGEPLVALRSVKAIVADTRSICARHGIAARFELTTNGVCSPEAARFLGDEIDTVVVSVDGDGPLHDTLRRHRDGRGTYTEVVQTLHRLERMPCELCIRACITAESVSQMPRLTAEFCSTFDFQVLAFEMLAETPRAAAEGVHAPDPYEFALAFMEAETIGAEHGVRVVHGPSELEGPRSTSCPLGTGSLMLWPDGAITACYLEPERWRSRRMKLDLGSVDASGQVHVDERLLKATRKLVEKKPRCERCFCRYTCAGGCHVDQTPPGCSLEYDDRCRVIRLITAARLLLRVGASAEAAALLAHPKAAEGLALHADDRLTSWGKVV